MKSMAMILGGVCCNCFCVLAVAQTSVDRSFTATGRECASVHWSTTALRKYPQIAAACQEVVERNGVAYVKFQGELSHNDGGRELKVKFKDAGEMTLTPPQDFTIYVGGTKVPVADMRRGDELTFYVAENRLAAQFYAERESPVTTTEYVAVPIVYTEQLAATLPATGSKLPWIGAVGMLFVSLAALLNARRLVRRF
jgi:LPXTG-motif cell wall-anchored protein